MITNENVVPIHGQERPDEQSGPENEMIVRKAILDRIDDSLRAERTWRQQGQKIQQIYKGRLDCRGRQSTNQTRFNALNSNVSVLEPSLFAKVPKADIRSRSSRPQPPEQEAAEVLEQMCDIFLDTSEAYNQLKAAVKDSLIPGRGVARVRWEPIVEETIAMDQDGNQFAIFEKLLDQISIEHVYWEDYVQEATADFKDVGWVAYRHLFTEKEFLEAFSDSVSVQSFMKSGKLSEIFTWTDYQAKRDPEMGYRDSRGHVNDELQDITKKALVWEYWDRQTREIIWLCADMNGHVLRIDEDILELENFFPSPRPLLAVTTTDTQIPVPEFVIYQDLAQEIDQISDRIAAISARIKVRGAYNATSEKVADMLKADDGIMIPINGAASDFDIKKHVYIMTNADNMAALQGLYAARQEAKQAMYEVTGISDIVRGQSRASETLGAQRLKSQFASLRIQDRKDNVELFCRDIIRIMCEIIAKQFDPQSLMWFIGTPISPEAIGILQTDAMRLSRIDVESDSTIVADEQAEIEAISAMTNSLASALQNLMPAVMSGMLSPIIATEMLKMLVKPFKGSRHVTQLIDAQIAQWSQNPPQMTQPAQENQNAPQS